VRVQGEGDGGNDLRFERSEVEDHVALECGGGVDVEDGLGRGTECAGLSVISVDPSGLADMAKDGGDVEGAEGEGFRPDAASNAVGDGVGRNGVVVLEDGTVLGDGPRKGSKARTDSVGVCVAVDASPCVLGAVVGGVVGWAGDDTETGAVVAVWRARR